MLQETYFNSPGSKSFALRAWHRTSKKKGNLAAGGCKTFTFRAQRKLCKTFTLGRHITRQAGITCQGLNELPLPNRQRFLCFCKENSRWKNKFRGPGKYAGDDKLGWGSAKKKCEGSCILQPLWQATRWQVEWWRLLKYGSNRIDSNAIFAPLISAPACGQCDIENPKPSTTRNILEQVKSQTHWAFRAAKVEMGTACQMQGVEIQAMLSIQQISFTFPSTQGILSSVCVQDYYAGLRQQETQICSVYQGS